jgi:sec-independent protein translocase protein TatA
MGFSVTHLLVVLAIVTVVFGTKRLRNIGTDLGGAIQGFRTAMTEGECPPAADKGDVVEGEITAPKIDKS